MYSNVMKTVKCFYQKFLVNYKRFLFIHLDKNTNEVMVDEILIIHFRNPP